MEMEAGNSVVLGEWRLLPERVALHQPTGTLVVADLHVGYCRERTLRGDAVPVPAIDAEMAPLLRAWNREKARGLVIAGDLVEKSRPDLIQALGNWLECSGIRMEGLVRGNHDGAKSTWDFPILPDGHPVGRHSIWHQYPRISEPLVHGHEHPALPLLGLGLVPCFLFSEQRLILPAYSQDAAGGNIFRRKDIQELRAMRCVAVAGKRVEELGTVEEIEKNLLGQRWSRKKR